MNGTLQHPFTLVVMPCSKDPSRFEWEVRERTHVLRRSMYSLASEKEARAQGEVALQEAAEMWRDSR